MALTLVPSLHNAPVENINSHHSAYRLAGGHLGGSITDEFEMASRAGLSGAGGPPPGGGPSITAGSTSDPILRNALRYTISTREYALLHKYVISRSRVLKKRAPTVDTVQRIMDGTPQNRSRAQSIGKGDRRKGKGKEGEEDKAPLVGGADDYNARAIRHSIRVFIATGALMKLWEVASARLMGKKKEYARPQTLDPGYCELTDTLPAPRQRRRRSNPCTNPRPFGSRCLSARSC